MKKFLMACGLLSILGAVGLVASGCGADACATYNTDAANKLTSCGITSTVSGSATSASVTCTDALAKRANCLDACLGKLDCACTKDPTGSGCATTLKPYADCVTACPM